MDPSAAVGPAVEVTKGICDAVSRRIDRLKNLEGKCEELNRKVQDLNYRKDDVSRKITGKKATNQCEGWLKEADNIQNRWKEIEEEYKKIEECKNNMVCLGGWCPNIIRSRLNLAKRIMALISEVDYRMDQYSQIKEDLVIDEPTQMMGMPAPGVEVKSVVDHTVQELLGMIKNRSITKLGLWGMGGVGKTTIMEVLHDRQEIRQMFDLIIWVTVTKEGTTTSVRQQLAQRLNVNVEGTNADILKGNVCKALKDKKFLLFLDDVWRVIDLEEVGVPGLVDGNGCKVVLSSRTLRVCRHMSTDQEINVLALSAEESWSLFRRKVGEVVVSCSEIEELAREIVSECDGLPLAILVVGSNLRKVKDIHKWRYLRNELRSSVCEIEDMDDRVYSRLKTSYDQLDERSKQCFLYCALFPEDHKIPKVELVNYWINEGLIDRWSNLKEAEDKGFVKVEELIDASLVENAGDYVKMHDLMRDLALRISSTNSEGCWRSFVRAGVKLSEMPKAEDWETAKRISLRYKDILKFANLKILGQVAPNCRMLTTLLLQGNSWLREIPSNFFEHMPILQVLNLSRTFIFSLPPSIGSLGNLRGLYLNDCSLLHVIPPEIGRLTELVIFQMKGRTAIGYLPPEIEHLASLKHLEVKCRPTCMWQSTSEYVMKIFPRLSKLSRLERLGIFVDNQMNGYDWWGKYHSKGVSTEISKLDKLTHLVFTFGKIDYFEDFVQRSSPWKHRNLTTFRIAIQKEGSYPTCGLRDWDEFYFGGICWGRSHRLDGRSKGMMVCHDVTKSIDFDEILTRVDSLAVVGDKVAPRISSDLSLEKLQGLKHFFAIEWNCMETLILVDSDGEQNTDLLPSLQQLVLQDLDNMKSIWEGPSLPPPPQGRRCFPSLTSLTINHCPMLKRIFSRGLIAHLSNLQILEVENCCQVEEIISMDEEEEVIQEELLPRLKTLSLSELSKLACICSSKELSSAGWPSLEEIVIRNCGSLKSLPSGFAKASNLQKIAVDRLWWKALEWEDDAVKQRLYSKAQFRLFFD